MVRRSWLRFRRSEDKTTLAITHDAFRLVWPRRSCSDQSTPHLRSCRSSSSTTFTETTLRGRGWESAASSLTFSIPTFELIFLSFTFLFCPYCILTQVFMYIFPSFYSYLQQIAHFSHWAFRFFSYDLPEFTHFFFMSCWTTIRFFFVFSLRYLLCVHLPYTSAIVAFLEYYSFM